MAWLQRARCGPEKSPHPAGEMALVRKADGPGDLTRRKLARSQELLRSRHAATHDVAVDRLADMCGELAPKMGAARAGNIRECHKRERLPEMRFDVIDHALKPLPSDRRRIPGNGVQQLDGQRDAKTVEIELVCRLVGRKKRCSELARP